MRAHRTGVLVGVLVGAVVVLSGCADRGGESWVDVTTAPVDAEEAAEDPAGHGGPALAPGAATSGVPGLSTDGTGGTGWGAAWTADDDLVYVVASASSTCPLVAEAEAERHGEEVVVSFLEKADDGRCTRDLVPVTTVVRLPPGVDPADGLDLVVGDLGTVRMPPFDDTRAGTAAPEFVWGGDPSS
ncbi:hypothetical protein [Oerskovia flava]|uniref:hypothetical protein n=1 Tax=Oerskovia flava TaxID=2986422 RepID=UPI0022405A51|nr:hypothetical protein [Oerskovia sp. JB1-3-2]